MAKKTKGPEHCSFCGRTEAEAGALLHGMESQICPDCILQGYQLLGGVVSTPGGAPESAPLEALHELPKPREIKEFLDDYVVGQDEAKRYLSVAVYNHYKRLMQPSSEVDGVEIEKSNILLLGPTGTGKTLLAKTIARLLKVPFTIVDATVLAQAGYVGEDIESLLTRLLQVADYDVAAAERGIVFIDEIDKIGRKGENASITRDVSGEGVQQALLKIIEGTVASVPPQGGRKHPHQQFLEIDTSGILFIAAGAFAGIEDIVKARLGQRSTGFGSELKSAAEMGDLYESVTAEDLHKFGMIPEFIGRLPVLTSTKELSEEDLVRVLTEPTNCLVSQYQHLFELDGIALEFTHDALLAIAELANQRKTGARGLSSVMEATLSDLMFDLPSRDDVARVVVTRDAVLGQGRAELYEAEPASMQSA